MPPLGYLAGATGDPINLVRQIAQQATRGVPATSGFVDFRENGGPLALTPSEIERLVISRGGMPELPLPGKITVGDGPIEMGDFDPADAGLINLFGNVFKKYTKTHAGTNTYWDWLFAPDAATAAAPFLTVLSDTDVQPRMRYMDVMAKGFVITAKSNDNLAISFPVKSGDYDLFGIPTQITGTASTLPILLKTWPGNWSTADKTIGIKVISIANIADTTDPRVTVETYIGAGGTAGGSPQTIHLGRGTELNDDTGAMFGKRAEQVLVYWPVGATLVANDVFEIPQNRAQWALSLPTAYPISSINAWIDVDGVRTRFEGGWTLTVEWDTLESIGDVFGRQGYTVERRGKLRATMALTRRLVDLEFQRRLHEAETVAVVIDAATDSLIPGAAVPFHGIFVLPYCRVFGTMFDVAAGGDNRDEPISIRAGVPPSPYTYLGETYSAHVNARIHTNVAAFTG